MNRSPVAGEVVREREQLLDVLLGQHVGAGGDVADERDVAHRPALDRGARGRVEADLDGPRLGGVAAQEAQALQRGEVAVHRGRRGEADRLADLAHARRVAALAHAGLDEVEDASLAGGELFGHVAQRTRVRAARSNIRSCNKCSIRG